jgi:hypothetical protein
VQVWGTHLPEQFVAWLGIELHGVQLLRGDCHGTHGHGEVVQ